MPKGHYKRPKRKAYPPKLITEKSQKFVEYITTEKTETYFNPIKSLSAAGYSVKGNPYYTIGRLLCNNNILDGLSKALHKNTVLTEIKGITAKERIWSELESALVECKPWEKQSEDGQTTTTIPGDMTNRIRVIELMGKFHQLWSDKVTISVETYEKMSEEHMHELLELSKLRHLRSSSVVEAEFAEPGSSDSRLLQGYSEPILDGMSIQDTVGIDYGSQAITDNEPVFPVSTDDNDSNDNDLQSSESDNLNPT